MIKNEFLKTSLTVKSRTLYAIAQWRENKILTNFVILCTIIFMEKVIINDIRILNPSIIWALFGLLFSIGFLSAGAHYSAPFFIIMLPFLICSIPYILKFFLRKKIKLCSNYLIVSNAFFALRRFSLSEIKNIEILIIKNLPIYQSADLPIHQVKRNIRNIRLQGEINIHDIAKIIVYGLNENILYNHNIGHLKKNLFITELIEANLDPGASGKIYLKFINGSVELERVELFDTIEEANRHWMNVR